MQRGKKAGGGGGASDEVDRAIASHPVVQTLVRLDDQLLELEKKHRAAKLELDKRFEGGYDRLLDRRRQRLSVPSSPAGVGKDAADADSAACAGGEAAASSTAKPTPVAQGQGKATPAIPGFWKTVLQNTDEFQEFIEEYDEPVLDYLQDIRYEPLSGDVATGIRLRFLFEPNPFFSNGELQKEYHTQAKSAFIDQLDCMKIQVSKIDWSVGKNVTVEVVSKKAKGMGRKRNQKAKREELPRRSFFRCFFRNLGPDEMIPEEELEDLEDDEEDLADLMEVLLEDDYECALVLKEHVAPHAVRWYTGDACDVDDEDDEDDESDGAGSDAEPLEADVGASDAAPDGPKRGTAAAPGRAA